MQAAWASFQVQIDKAICSKIPLYLIAPVEKYKEEQDRNEVHFLNIPAFLNSKNLFNVPN